LIVSQPSTAPAHSPPSSATPATIRHGSTTSISISRHSARCRWKSKSTTLRRHWWLTESHVSCTLFSQPPSRRASSGSDSEEGRAAPMPRSMRKGETAAVGSTRRHSPSSITSDHACASDCRTIM
jgi:hypothetical protein